jgi:hypothetical protein
METLLLVYARGRERAVAECSRRSGGAAEHSGRSPRMKRFRAGHLYSREATWSLNLDPNRQFRHCPSGGHHRSLTLGLLPRTYAFDGGPPLCPLSSSHSSNVAATTMIYTPSWSPTKGHRSRAVTTTREFGRARTLFPPPNCTDPAGLLQFIPIRSWKMTLESGARLAVIGGKHARGEGRADDAAPTCQPVENLGPRGMGW